MDSTWGRDAGIWEHWPARAHVHKGNKPNLTFGSRKLTSFDRLGEALALRAVTCKSVVHSIASTYM